MLLAPGCGREPDRKAPSNDEPVRRAAFRAAIAGDFLSSCPGGLGRAETQRQIQRHGELGELGARKRAGHALWLGRNDYDALGRHSDRGRCRPGEPAYRAALADYGAALDALAGRIADYRP